VRRQFLPTSKTPKEKTTSKTKAKTKPKAKTKAKPKPTAKAKPTAEQEVEPKRQKVTAIKEVKSMDYSILLKRARDKIPPEVFDQPRFKIPKVDSITQGSRTVIRNFKDITDTIRRNPDHLIRYMAHELATAGETRGRQVIFNGRFTSSVLEELIERYTKEFVLCPICNRPDTEIKREDRLLILVCTACGGRTPLKGA